MEAASVHQQMMNSQYQIRKAQIDDVEEIVELLEKRPREKEALNSIFNYGQVLSLVETNLLSVVVVDNSTNSLIGVVSLDNHPAISTGMVDFLHSNHWENWFDRLFNVPAES